MKNSVKKMFGLFCCVCLFLYISIPMDSYSETDSKDSEGGLAANIDISQIDLGSKIVLDDRSVLTPISKAEYLDRAAAAKEISHIKTENSDETKSRYDSEIGITYYYEYSKTFVYDKNPEYKVDLEATLKIWCDNNYRQIEDVMAVGTRISTETQGIWKQTYAYAVPERESDQFPATEVTIGANGYFDIEIDSSKETDIPGFTYGGSNGKTSYYTSETLSVRSTYRLY